MFKYTIKTTFTTILTHFGYAKLWILSRLKYNNIKITCIRGEKSIFCWSDYTSVVYYILIYNNVLNGWSPPISTSAQAVLKKFTKWHYFIHY